MFSILWIAEFVASSFRASRDYRLIIRLSSIFIQYSHSAVRSAAYRPGKVRPRRAKRVSMCYPHSILWQESFPAVCQSILACLVRWASDTPSVLMPYRKGPGVKKSGPKGPSKIKGKVLEALLKEFEENPSDPSHVIADRVTRRTGVSVAARSVRDLRH